MATNLNIESILRDINKQYGSGSARLLNDSSDLDIERIGSGSLNLDIALGGGFPRGRTVELYGPESSGKTTVALLHASEVQKADPEKYVLFIDLEHAIDPALVRKYGIEEGKFIITQPDTGEQALNISESFIRSGIISLVIMDSVSALLPEAEAKGEMGDQQIGLQARLMSKALRKLTPVANQYNCTVIFINQIREKIGVMYGNPETTSGGRALSFYASVRIAVRAGDKILNPNNKEDVLGHLVNIRISKNKTAQPFKKCSFELIYGIGVDKIAEVFDIALLIGLITRAGAYYQIKDKKGAVIERLISGKKESVKLSFQGKPSAVEYLKQDRNLFLIIENSIRTGILPTEEQLLNTSS